MSVTLQTISWVLIGLCGLLALRLALTASRERSLPEALMALFFAGGSLGYACLVLPTTLGLSEAGALVGYHVSNWAFLLPHCTVAFFTWRVFRPDVGWARAAAISLVLGSVLVQAAAFVLARVHGEEVMAASTMGALLFWSGAAMRAISFGWACGESAGYYVKARRRVTLGLGDPVVANRFLLWALWSGASASMLALRVTSSLLSGGQVAPRPEAPLWIVLSQMVAAVVCALAVWLTFAAPRFYRSWLAKTAH